MSVKISAEAWHQSDTAGPSELLVLLALADNADTESREAWPSVPHLAAKTKTSEQTVRRALRRLEQRGQISVVAAENTRHRSVTYRVHPAPPTPDPFQNGTPATGGRVALPPVVPEPSRTTTNDNSNSNGSRAQTASKDRESVHG